MLKTYLMLEYNEERSFKFHKAHNAREKAFLSERKRKNERGDTIALILEGMDKDLGF